LCYIDVPLDKRKAMTSSRIAKTSKAPKKSATSSTVNKAGNGATIATPATFAPGQKWQLDLGHAEIVHVGKVLIDYRYYRVETQRHVPVETKTLVDFAATLKKKKAKLVASN
jgi:hypothetical protein